MAVQPPNIESKRQRIEKVHQGMLQMLMRQDIKIKLSKKKAERRKELLEEQLQGLGVSPRSLRHQIIDLDDSINKETVPEEVANAVGSTYLFVHQGSTHQKMHR